MAIQVIGVEARFDTKQFNVGLNQYVSGLKQATLATRRAAKEMSGLGANLSAAFQKGGQLNKTLIPAINGMTKGFQKTNTVVSRTGHIFNQNKALLEATQAQIRDNIRLAEIRALRESRNTSELKKQLLFLEQLSIKSSSIQRKASLRQQGFAPQQIAQTVRAAGSARIDPLKDFSPGVIKKLQSDLDQATSKTNKFTAALRKLGGGAKGASSGLQGLSTVGVAVGVALGQVAFAAISRITSALTRLLSVGTETATFFERLGLSINFFAARTARQADETLGFRDALKQTQGEAEGLLIWVKQLAVASPFTAKQVGTVFRVSQAYGLLAEEAQVLLPLLIDLGSATGLDPQTLENAARALGQIRSRGKLTGEEIRQLGNAGIPIRDILVKELGVTQVAFDKLLESGALISDLVIPAIVDSLKDFEGAAETVAFETIGGLISAFEDIKDIALGEFFGAVLKPLKPLLLDLVETLNDPSFRAGLLIIGEEIGQKITGAIQSLTSAVQGLFKAWQKLGPETQRNVILFAAAFAGAIALIGVFSLLFFAITTLVNPVTVVAFLLADWVTSSVTGFSVVAKAAEAMGRIIANVFQGIGNFFSRIINSIFGLSDATEEGFSAVADNARSFGQETGEEFGRGLAEGGVSGVVSAVNDIAAAFTGELRPASIPPGLPPIDDWMYEVGFIGGSQVGAGMSSGISSGINVVASTLDQEIKGLNEGILNFLEDEEQEFAIRGAKNGRAIVRGVGSATEALGDKVAEDFEIVAETGGSAAYQAGIDVSDAFVSGFGLLFRRPADIINPAIEKLVAAIGGGRQLSKAGAFAFTDFLDGFLDADFGALDAASGLVEDFLGSLAGLSEIEDIDLPRTLFATKEALARAIGEARKFGKISSDAFNAVREAAGGLGEQVGGFLERYTALVLETEAVKKAQEELNAVTEKYDNLLDPLKDKLSEVSDERQTAQEIKQIAGLQRILNSSITTEENKRIAAAQILEIQTRQQIRALEIQRTQEERVAKTAVEGAEEKEEAAKKELDIFQLRLKAQLDQLGLVADEAGIIEGLQKELDKTNEKGLSVLERQLKFAALQKSELADNVTAAKARLVLEDASASEQEKAAANLQLQTVALNRLKREQEAVELGFKEEDLINLRDIAVTLDDIGKKGKDGGGELEGRELDTSTIVDAAAVAEEFAAIGVKVAKSWEEAKEKIRDTLRFINDNLPDFLKLFPDETTQGEIPIVQSLLDIGLAILQVGVAWKLVGMGTVIIPALKGVFTFLGGGALVGKVSAAFLAIAGGSTAAAAAIAILVAAVIGFGVAYAFNIGGTRDVTNEWFAEVAQGFTDMGVLVSAAGEFVKQSLQSILNPESVEFLPILRQKIEEAGADFEGSGRFFQDNAAELGIKTGEALGENIAATTAEELQNPANFNLLEEASRFLGSAVPKGFNEAITAESGRVVGLDELIAGVTKAEPEVLKAAQDVGTEVGASITSGIPLGLLNENSLAEMTEAAEATIAAQITALEESADIKSPSGVTFEKIGVPLGEGIREGMLSVETSDATQTLIDAIIDKFESLKGRAERKFTQLNTLLVTKNKALQTKLVTLTQETNDQMLDSFTAFIEDVGIAFDGLFENILDGWENLGDESLDVVEEGTQNIIDEYSTLGDGIIGTSDEEGLRKLKNDIIAIWTDLMVDQETPLNNIRDQIIGIWITDQNSIINELGRALFGTGGGATQESPTWSLGASIMGGIAQGITDNGPVVREALKDSLISALHSAEGAIGADSPSTLFAAALGQPISEGVAAGIASGSGLISQALSGTISNALSSAISPLTSPGSSTAVPGSVSNISNTSNFNLNVSSAQSSQGIISDFGILRTMAST